jgi:hypothetical protein
MGAMAFVVAAVPLAPRAGFAGDDGVHFQLAACSRVVRRQCSECAEIALPARGGFVAALAPDAPADGRAETALVTDLAIDADGFSAHGRGLLLHLGNRVSFLAEIDVGAGPELAIGSGWVAGAFPAILHIDRMAVGGWRLELYIVPVGVVDDDADGVADGDDRCPGTACGAVVDPVGCALDQQCPCAARLDGSSWRTHREYVRCVIAATRRLVGFGRLDSGSRTGLVRIAAASVCGRSALASLELDGHTR